MSFASCFSFTGPPGPAGDDGTLRAGAARAQDGRRRIVRGEIVTQIADENRRAHVAAESEWLAELPARAPRRTADPAA